MAELQRQFARRVPAKRSLPVLEKSLASVSKKLRPTRDNLVRFLHLIRDGEMNRKLDEETKRRLRLIKDPGDFFYEFDQVAPVDGVLHHGNGREYFGKYLELRKLIENRRGEIAAKALVQIKQPERKTQLTGMRPSFTPPYVWPAADIAEDSDVEDAEDDNAAPDRNNRSYSPFEMREESDIEYELFSLRMSLMRNNFKFYEIIQLYSQGIRGMIPTFKYLAKKEMYKTAALHIVAFLQRLESFFASTAGIYEHEEGEVDEINIEELIAMLEEYRLPTSALSRVLKATRDSGKFEEYGADDQAVIAGDQIRQMQSNYDPMFNQAIFATHNIVNNAIIPRLIEAIIHEYENQGIDMGDFKKAYLAVLRHFSHIVHPREKRPPKETLHSPRVEYVSAQHDGAMEKLPPHLWRQEREAFGATMEAVKAGERGVFFEMTPGSGKTKIIGLLIKWLNPDGNTLVLNPSRAGCRQTHEMLCKQLGTSNIGLVVDDTAILDQRVTIGTYQSFQSYIQQRLFQHDKFGLVVCDEAHRSLTEQRHAIRNYFHDAQIIGATASSEDINGGNVSDVLKRVYYISLLDGMKAGIFNPTKYYQFKLPDSKENDIEQRCAMLHSFYEKKCPGEQVLIVVNDINRAETVAEYFRGKRISAQAIHSKMNDKKCLELGALFKEGKISMLVVCDMLTESWDHKPLGNLFLGDEGFAEWEAIQRLGRVGRIMPGKKPSVVCELRGGYRSIGSARWGDRLKRPAANGTSRNPFDVLFRLRERGFRNGQLLVEPKIGYWPSQNA